MSAPISWENAVQTVLGIGYDNDEYQSINLGQPTGQADRELSVEVGGLSWRERVSGCVRGWVVGGYVLLICVVVFMGSLVYIFVMVFQKSMQYLISTRGEDLKREGNMKTRLFVLVMLVLLIGACSTDCPDCVCPEYPQCPECQECPDQDCPEVEQAECPDAECPEPECPAAECPECEGGWTVLEVVETEGQRLVPEEVTPGQWFIENPSDRGCGIEVWDSLDTQSDRLFLHYEDGDSYVRIPDNARLAGFVGTDECTWSRIED